MLARGGCGYILRHLPPPFRSFAVFEHANSPRRHVRRIQPHDASVIHFDIKTKPVGAEHAARRIESHRGGDEPLKIRPRAYYETLADVLRPGHATDQRIVEETAFEGYGVGNLAQLHQLKQDRDLGQIGDYDSRLAGGEPLQLDMQLGRPFALELLTGQGQTL